MAPCLVDSLTVRTKHLSSHARHLGAQCTSNTEVYVDGPQHRAPRQVVVVGESLGSVGPGSTPYRGSNVRLCARKSREGTTSRLGLPLLARGVRATIAVTLRHCPSRVYCAVVYFTAVPCIMHPKRTHSLMLSANKDWCQTSLCIDSVPSSTSSSTPTSEVPCLPAPHL